MKRQMKTYGVNAVVISNDTLVPVVSRRSFPVLAHNSAEAYSAAKRFCREASAVHPARSMHFSRKDISPINLLESLSSAIAKSLRSRFEIQDLGDGEYVVSIKYGELRHDHEACDSVMDEMGLSKVLECVSEELCDGIYSSEHFFKIKAIFKN